MLYSATIRTLEVRCLLYEWAKEWRRGSEPKVVNDIFCTLTSGASFEEITDTVFRLVKNLDIGYESVSVASVASLIILREDQKDFLYLFKHIEAMLRGGQFTGEMCKCLAVGIILAAAILGGGTVLSYERHYVEIDGFEHDLWPLVTWLAVVVAKSPNPIEIRNSGKFCNIISEYLNPHGINPGTIPAASKLARRRQARLSAALVKLHKQLDNNRDAIVDALKPNHFVYCLFSEMTYKTFGRMKLSRRIGLLANLK